MEVSRISTLMAEELGADVFICKKGGLFHDIGKPWTTTCRAATRNWATRS